MARQTSVTLTDDIDGGRAVETVLFGLDGNQYEIDLGAKNARNLRKAFAAYIEAGRKVRTNTASRSATKKTAALLDGSELAAIRAWAQVNGIPVAARGRIAAPVKEQYLAANGG